MRITDAWPWHGNLLHLYWLISNLRTFGELRDDYWISFNNRSGALRITLDGPGSDNDTLVQPGQFVWMRGPFVESGTLEAYKREKEHEAKNVPPQTNPL